MSVDVLSEVLSAVRLTSSVFFDVTASSPWVAEAPPSSQLAQAIQPGAQHAIEYHVLTRGNCWITVVDGEPIDPVFMQEGDIALIPHGEAHVLSSKPGMRTQLDLDAFQSANDAESLPFRLRTGAEGGGDATLICGFFTCDVRPFNPLLGALPRLMCVGHATSSAGETLLRQLILTISHAATDRRSGAQSVLNKLSELILIEAIRVYMEDLSADDTGWLSGLRDPLVGRAITLLHAKPDSPWTLDGLASECGASRSALVGRFTQLIGYPPIQYLTRWRMQLAAKRLSEGGVKIAAVAREVGYDSEAAFSRAFKKYSGLPPSEWRP